MFAGLIDQNVSGKFMLSIKMISLTRLGDTFAEEI